VVWGWEFGGLGLGGGLVVRARKGIGIAIGGREIKRRERGGEGGGIGLL